MTGNIPATLDPQSPLIDDFFYFFLRLRKDRIRKVARAIQDRYPGEPRVQLARRLIDSQTQLSLLAGSILDLPLVIPGLGQALQVLGFVSGAAALVRMHLYLILEIAFLYGKDIDDEARVPEMVAVVAASSMAAGTSLLTRWAKLNPWLSLATGGMAAAAVARLIGEQAIRYYSQEETAPASATPQDNPA